MYSKNSIGACPYCASTDFVETETVKDDPRRHIKKCDGCSRWSALSLVNTNQYPLSDPLDSESTPGSSFDYELA